MSAPEVYECEQNLFGSARVRCDHQTTFEVLDTSLLATVKPAYADHVQGARTDILEPEQLGHPERLAPKPDRVCCLARQHLKPGNSAEYPCLGTRGRLCLDQ